jgi:hypothetical protein
MQYLCLIYEAEAVEAIRSEAEQGQTYQEYMAFSQEVGENGKMVGGNALMPTDTATTIHVRDGELTVCDGPFAETKEQLGGYYLLECENLDDAINTASKIPSAKTGRIEIRPIMVFEQ